MTDEHKFRVCSCNEGFLVFLPEGQELSDAEGPHVPHEQGLYAGLLVRDGDVPILVNCELDMSATDDLEFLADDASHVRCRVHRNEDGSCGWQYFTGETWEPMR